MTPIHIPQGQYHTIPEVAEMYGVTRMTVNNWLNRGQLSGVKTPLGWLIEAEQLETFRPPKAGRPRRVRND